MNWQFFDPHFSYEESYPDHDSFWSGHKLFAYDLVRNISPKTIVELGTEKGSSFYSLCQAILDANLGTSIYAIDNWVGDLHTGLYGETIYSNFLLILEQYYQQVDTKILRMTFDEGLLLFEDHSIDLLHIDGCHTYEMVKHDFDSWFPKMSPSGVIILHDTTERQENFGVYKLWEEIETRFPFTLNFIHSHGLGLIFVNGFPFETTRQDNITNIFTRYYKLFSEKEKNFGILSIKENSSHI